MPETTTKKRVADKLLLKPGQSLYLLDAPDDYERLVGGLPRDVRVATRSSELPCDHAHLFATSKRELRDLLPKAIRAVRPDGLLWIAYPRVDTGSHDISREAVHEALRANGWRPVTQISVDDTWTAIRARPVAG